MIVIDTHAWIWWAATDRRLSARASQAIREAEMVWLSAISCWEVATLYRLGRVGFGLPFDDWLTTALKLPKLVVVPVSDRIATEAGRFEDMHGDLADRILVATALQHRDAMLVTKDRQLHSVKRIKTVW